ncbi:uncharacterized protein LOC141715205 [Apium graveolens]|uniref:uncharacterized protein LOC141715205 n=1 Tax=Apium graveolens TaxID=4045 RepID=UPI003D79F8F0
MFEVAPMYDDDDVEYMFDSVAFLSLRNYVELYVEKISINFVQNSNVRGEMSISGERSSSSYNSKKLQISESGEVSGGFSGGVSGSISSGSSSRCTSRLDSDNNLRELRKGKMFHTKKELMRVVKDVHIANHQEIKVLKSDSGVWEVECKRKDHYNLSSANIAHVISTQIAADPSISEKVLKATAVSHFGYRPSRRKIRHARWMTEKAIFKSSEESYEYLPKFMNALLSFNHGTVVDWYFKEHNLGEPIAEVVTFKRVFWALKPCIDAFPHCITVLLIDGTHLYDKYGGVLLIATIVDGFNHLLPVAFAVVDGENKASWSWFMERVKKKIVLQRRDVCVISDRHNGIISVMNNPELGWCEPLSHHRHWNALVAAEPRVEEWFADKPLSRWALAFDEGKKFGIMTTNMAESWNSAIKVARKLPIAALVKTIFHKLAAYFDQRRIEVEK